jgi:FkbM family methyltransferase
VADLKTDARLATGTGSFLRLARVRLIPVGHAAVPVSLEVDGARFDVFVRPRSSDPVVVKETFSGQYHLPPIGLALVNTVLDLGANIGLTMAHLATVCPRATVVGVELDRANVELAKRNTARWGDRCSVIEGAVWVRDEVVRYRLTEQAECGAALSAEGEQEAQGISLNSLLGRLGWDAVDFVKMDIEGAEKAVLRQNTQWASRVRSIKVEAHGDYGRDECLADLERLGFDGSIDPRHPGSGHWYPPGVIVLVCAANSHGSHTLGAHGVA